jgi:hypothetical protein
MAAAAARVENFILRSIEKIFYCKEKMGLYPKSSVAFDELVKVARTVVNSCNGDT